MTAGLFICDHVNPEYQNEFGDYPDMFKNLFPEFNWKLYDVCNNHFPEHIDECDLYMTTGSRHSVYENIDWINKVKKTIREIYVRDKYFIGFCFGHQLMGEALGGKVGKSPNGWCVGVHKFKIMGKKEWMSPFQSTINLLMMCQDQVLELPEGAELLAGNKKCPNGIFQVGRKMLGIQAHPEFSKAYDKLLMEIRIKRMGEEVVENGIISLEKKVHWEIIRDWVIGFLWHDN